MMTPHWTAENTNTSVCFHVFLILHNMCPHVWEHSTHMHSLELTFFSSLFVAPQRTKTTTAGANFFFFLEMLRDSGSCLVSCVPLSLCVCRVKANETGMNLTSCSHMHCSKRFKRGGKELSWRIDMNYSLHQIREGMEETQRKNERLRQRWKRGRLGERQTDGWIDEWVTCSCSSNDDRDIMMVLFY